MDLKTIACIEYWNDEIKLKGDTSIFLKINYSRNFYVSRKRGRRGVGFCESAYFCIKVSSFPDYPSQIARCFDAHKSFLPEGDFNVAFFECDTLREAFLRFYDISSFLFVTCSRACGLIHLWRRAALEKMSGRSSATARKSISSAES